MRPHISRLPTVSTVQPHRHSARIRPPKTQVLSIPIKPPRAEVLSERFSGSSATFTRPVLVVPTGGIFITSVKITSDTTIAAHADNHWTFELQTVAGTVIATRSTDSDVDGVMTADVVYSLSRTVSECDLAADVVLELEATGAGAPVDQSATQFNLVIEYIPLGSSRDFIHPVMIAPSTGMFITAASIVSDTTITEDAADYYTFTLQTAAGTAIASRNTLTGGGGTLTADTAAALSRTVADCDQASGTHIELKVDAATESAASIMSANLVLNIEYLPATSRDFTHSVMVVPTGGVQITKVEVISDTTIANHATDYYTLTLQTSGGTAIATRNTKTGEGGELTADTAKELTRTYADCDQAAGVHLELKVDAATESAAALSDVNLTVNIEYLPKV